MNASTRANRFLWRAARTPGPLPARGRGAGLACLVCLLALGLQPALAGEHAPGDTGGKPPPPEETGIPNLAADSVRMDEDRLILDDQAFLVTTSTRCYDEKGRRVSVRSLPPSGTFSIRYVTRPQDEQHPAGPRTKVLRELRIVQPPTQRGEPQ